MHRGHRRDEGRNRSDDAYSGFVRKRGCEFQLLMLRLGGKKRPPAADEHTSSVGAAQRWCLSGTGDPRSASLQFSRLEKLNNALSLERTRMRGRSCSVCIHSLISQSVLRRRR